MTEVFSAGLHDAREPTWERRRDRVLLECSIAARRASPATARRWSMPLHGSRRVGHPVAAPLRRTIEETS